MKLALDLESPNFMPFFGGFDPGEGFFYCIKISRNIEEGISGIDYSELCTEMVVENPTDTDIQLLLDEASNAEQSRHQLLRNEVESNIDDVEKSELGMSRIVYGVCLAENTFDYLLGRESEPRYYTDMADYVSGTQKIVDFWRKRWLKSRLNYEPIYQRIREFDKQGFLVSNQIDEDEEWSFSKLTVTFGS